MKCFLSFITVVALACSASAQQPLSTHVVTPTFPKYVTAHVEFRDPTGARWPSFFYGKAATNGVVRLDAKQPAANLKLDCNERPQKNGDQSRRVLGELFSDPKSGGVTIAIDALRDVGSAEKGATKGTIAGSVNLPGKTIPFTAAVTLRPQNAGKSDEKNESLIVDFHFDTTAGDLGLKTFDTAARIGVRGTVTAYSEVAVSAAAAKKR